MAELDDLIARLRALGDRSIDPVVASEHLTAMAGVGRRTGARSRFGRVKVAAAFAAGLVLGGTSLASAGVMGETMRNKVADAGEVVGLDLPGGTERSTDGCGAITARNHGDFVRQGGDPKANCGKPQKAVDNKAGAGADAGDEAGDAGCKPPWAGKGLTKEQRAAARTPAALEAQATCDGETVETETETGAGGQGANNGKKPETTGTVTPQGQGVTPPGGGADDNAGVSGGSVPAPQSPADDIRPDAPGDGASPPSTLPGQADANADAAPGQGATTTTPAQP